MVPSSNSFFSSRSPSFTASLLTVSILTISTLALLQRRRNRSRGIVGEERDKEDREVLLPSSKDDDTGDDKRNNNQLHHRMTLEDELLAAGGSLTIQPIGVVRSVYRLCVGTPRQGLLAPHARGRIDLIVGKDAVLGLQEYSHIWIFFIFHLNTLPKQQQQKSNQNRSENGNSNKSNNHVHSYRRVPLKISPPALGGRKVGVLSTRSPHRPNPIGMTLARLDRIETNKKCAANGSNSKAGVATTTTSLYISGLDLVDGTPVIDIKPYVPHYDSPYYPLSSLSLLPLEDDIAHCRLPPWVSDGLATKRHVHFMPRALSDLKSIFDANPNALEFYGGNYDETMQEGVDNIKACMEQVLAIDVRSRWQSNKTRSGKFQAERAHRVQQTFASAVTTAVSISGVAAIEDSRSTTDSSSFHTSSDDTTDNNNINIDNNDGEKEMETCTQQLDRLLIHYNVSVPDEMNRPASSMGSGAEDLVQVTSIELLQTKT